MQVEELYIKAVLVDVSSSQYGPETLVHMSTMAPYNSESIFMSLQRTACLLPEGIELRITTTRVTREL